MKSRKARGTRLRLLHGQDFELRLQSDLTFSGTLHNQASIQIHTYLIALQTDMNGDWSFASGVPLPAASHFRERTDWPTSTGLRGGDAQYYNHVQAGGTLRVSVC